MLFNFYRSFEFEQLTTDDQTFLLTNSTSIHGNDFTIPSAVMHHADCSLDCFNFVMEEHTELSRDRAVENYKDSVYLSQ